MDFSVLGTAELKQKRKEDPETRKGQGNKQGLARCNSRTAIRCDEHSNTLTAVALLEGSHSIMFCIAPQCAA